MVLRAYLACFGPGDWGGGGGGGTGDIGGEGKGGVYDIYSGEGVKEFPALQMDILGRCFAQGIGIGGLGHLLS